MYLLNVACFLGAGTLPIGVSTPPKFSKNVPMSLRNLQKILVYGALIEAELFSSPPQYFINSAQFWVLALFP